MSRRALSACLLLLFLAGFALRFQGIRYGVPSKSQRLFTYHPDESGGFNIISQWGKNDFITSDLDVPPLIEKLKRAQASGDLMGRRILQLAGKDEKTIEGVDKLVIVNALNALLQEPALYDLARPDIVIRPDFRGLLNRAKNKEALPQRDLKRLNLALVMATYPEETQFTPKWKFNKFLYFHPGGASLWGGFHLYVFAGCLKASQLLGYLKVGSRDFYMSHLEEADKIYFTCRFVMMLLSSLSILLLYWIGKTAYDDRVGLAAAFFSMILPAHIVYSIVLKADPLMLFLLLISALFAAKNLKDPSVKNTFLAGFFLGLATATKFNAVPYAILVALSCILADSSAPKKNIQLLFLSGIFTILGFCVGSPYFVVEFPGLILEATKFAGSEPNTTIYKLIVGPTGWINYAIYYLPYAIGWPMTAAGIGSLLGLLFILIAKVATQRFDWSLENRYDVLFAASGCGIYFMTSATRQGGAHYTLTILPFLLLYGARLFSLGARSARLGARVAAWAAIVVVGGYTFVYSMAVTRLYTQENVREAASRWMEQNVPKSSVIGMIQYGAQMPTILRRYDPPYAMRVATDEAVDSKYKGSSIGLDLPVSRLEEVEKKSDYLILTEHEYMYYIHPKLEHLFPEQARVLKKVMGEMDEVARFEKDPEFLGVKFPKKTPPQEWMNPNGTILIFKKRAGNAQE